MNLTRIAAILMFAFLSSATALAQAPPAPPSSPATPSPTGRSNFDQPIQLIDLDFRGGTVAEYVESVRKACPDLTVVVLSDVSHIPMPAVRLKQVLPSTAVDLLNSIRQSESGQPFNLQAVPVPRNQNPTYAQVFTISSQSSPKPKAEDVDVSVVSVKELLVGGVTTQDALTAVQAAIDMLKADRDAAELRYHDGTGLLIIRGSDDQVVAAQRVVQALKERVEGVRANDEIQRETGSLRQQVTELHLQTEQARKQSEQAARQAMEWQTRSEVLEKELARARDALAAQEQSVRALQLELEAARGGARPARPGP